MNSMLTILVGAAAAAVLAVMAANTLKPADGSFAGETAPAPPRATRSDDTAAVAPQYNGRRPDYVVGTDAVARDRQTWQDVAAAAEPQESPRVPAEPAPDAQPALPAEPATQQDDPTR